MKLSKILKTSMDVSPVSIENGRQNLIDNLNKDLELEYAAAIQYIQHASLIEDFEFSKELMVHANEEIQHAMILSYCIKNLNGIPIVTVEEVNTSMNQREMLQQDIDGEFVAIERYRERILEADRLNESELKTELEKILSDEEEHAKDISEFLSK